MDCEKMGRLMVRVTLSGCGLPLDGAKIYINNAGYITVPDDNGGFSNVITLFEADKKGVKNLFDLRAEHGNAEALVCNRVPVTSGYLTIWNMPLEKSKSPK
ncbi:MAG: hypothetical protein E7671_05735 [Ruminococcaceae bacterium]|nr:hypothetical protein [Oscillospiraceae bacterium]